MGIKINEKNNELNELFEPLNNKQYFLNTLTQGTYKSYVRIFKITSKYEKALDKDLCQFTLKEVEKILYDFNSNNRNTIESYGRIISSYLNWAVKNGLTNQNVLSNFTPTDFEKYLTDGEVYMTEKQLRRYEDLYCENYQDSLILRLLFEGVCGRQCSEIRNLKKSDVNRDNNTLKLINALTEDEDGMPVKFTERIITVSDRTIDLINKANEKDIYIKKNGQMKSNPHVRAYTDLVRNDYVVRASITKTDHFNSPIDKFVIYRRIKNINETLDLDLTTKLLQRSGMIYYAKNIIGDTNNVSLSDLKMVADRFNLKSHHNLKGFLTVENINKTYK